jgi:hypothetical protein
VIDEVTRKWPAIDVAEGIRSARVIKRQPKPVSVDAVAKYRRSDVGRDFVCRAF